MILNFSDSESITKSELADFIQNDIDYQNSFTNTGLCFHVFYRVCIPGDIFILHIFDLAVCLNFCNSLLIGDCCDMFCENAILSRGHVVC